LRFGGPLDLFSRRRFRQAVTQDKPDIVLTWMSRATAACPAVPMHVARLGGYYDLKRYRHCQHLIGNTKGIARWLVEQGWPADRAHYLPNFVDATPAAPRPKRGKVVLALGRLHPNKGFDLLIEAMVRVPKARLWLLGDGPLGSELRDLARELNVDDRVEFLPWVDDPAPYYTAADVVCVASRIEPLGNVVLEAWAHGKPVVASLADGPVELIRDGETGLLADAEQPDRLAAALRRVLDSPDLAAQLAAHGRAAHEAEFTEHAVVAAYLDLFRRLS
ncbi:MAG: glycosyltransferase, partial [Alphaproteobacteria bacterium]